MGLKHAGLIIGEIGDEKVLPDKSRGIKFW
jgi:hypothetical protein